MSTKFKNLLPIGSVVQLIENEGEKKCMICGVMQTDKPSFFQKEKEYDYIGLLYPEGFVRTDMMFLFNHEDIKQVDFRGFEDEERALFIEELEKFYTVK